MKLRRKRAGDIACCLWKYYGYNSSMYQFCKFIRKKCLMEGTSSLLSDQDFNL